MKTNADGHQYFFVYFIQRKWERYDIILHLTVVCEKP